MWLQKSKADAALSQSGPSGGVGGDRGQRRGDNGCRCWSRQVKPLRPWVSLILMSEHLLASARVASHCGRVESYCLHGAAQAANRNQEPPFVVSLYGCFGCPGGGGRSNADGQWTDRARDALAIVTQGRGWRRASATLHHQTDRSWADRWEGWGPGRPSSDFRLWAGCPAPEEMVTSQGPQSLPGRACVHSKGEFLDFPNP